MQTFPLQTARRTVRIEGRKNEPEGAQSGMKLFYLLLLLALLAGCAKPLQPENYTTRIASVQLNQNTFQISYRPADDSDLETAIDLSLLRSAEVALKYGFNYFVIVNPGDVIPVDDPSRPVKTVFQGENHESTDGAEIMTHLVRSAARPEPGTSNTIVCFEKKPPGFAYVALFVKASVRSKYGLDRAVY